MLTKERIENVLSNLAIQALNPMQESVVNAERNTPNILLLSPTGSGKTLAFLLRVLDILDADKSGIQVLIVAPARELVLQIEEVFRSMKTGFKVSVCYGGHHSRTEQNRLSESPAVVIGTPGRLFDHISKGVIDSSTIQLLVLDEFDKSLEMGFQDQLEVIFNSLSGKQKHMLTSATELDVFPGFVPFRNPKVFNFLKDKVESKLRLALIKTPAEEKLETLLKLISSFKQEVSLVFCNHREAVERIGIHFREMGFAHGIFHGAMEQVDRERNLIKFRSGSCLVLIATDLAARGLDIPEIRHVVHYQLPVHEDAFIHRNGRTARMHADGQAYIIQGDDEKLPDYMKGSIPEMNLPAHLEKIPLPEFECVYFSAGKKEKISKGDLVGLLMKKGEMSQSDIGLITITDQASFVAIRRTKVPAFLKRIVGEKLKKAKVKVSVAR
jgi:superfamily II DNA/RNA helicase